MQIIIIIILDMLLILNTQTTDLNFATNQFVTKVLKFGIRPKKKSFSHTFAKKDMCYAIFLNFFILENELSLCDFFFFFK